MNGPRTLSNDHLSYLVISTPLSSKTDPASDSEYDLLMCAPHFVGDGTALHQSTHDLLCILTSTQTNEELKAELDGHHDWVRRNIYLSVHRETDIRHRKIFCRRPSKLDYPLPDPRSQRQLPRLTFCRPLGERSYVLIICWCPLWRFMVFVQPTGWSHLHTNSAWTSAYSAH